MWMIVIEVVAGTESTVEGRHGEQQWCSGEHITVSGTKSVIGLDISSTLNSLSHFE